MTAEHAIPRNCWYLAFPASDLKRGKLVAKTILGEPIVFGRDKDGAVFALRDICPHRAMPLSFGKFDGTEIECMYHGWRFGTDGVCTEIPSLVSEQKILLHKICVQHFPCREVQHIIWVYIGDAEAPATDDLPDIPYIEEAGDKPPKIVKSLPVTAAFDDAVIGLIDPAHGPYVHKVWWWRSSKGLREKTKTYEPSPFGFTMTRHAPSQNSKVFKFMGGGVSTEISFRLPGVRVETLHLGPKYRYVGMTAITPLEPGRCEINHVMYWTHPLLSVAKPVINYLAGEFLDQDKDVMDKQWVGMAHKPNVMLINEADTLARWYFALKRENRDSYSEERPFRNPLKKTVLRWRT